MGLQETRIAKLLVQLKTRLAPFIAGEAEAFREVQAINAQQLAAASFGSVMLQVGGCELRSKLTLWCWWFAGGFTCPCMLAHVCL
jgi:hypothetical protein